MALFTPPAIVRTQVWRLSPKATIYFPIISGLRNSQVQQLINHRLQNIIHHLLVSQGYFQNKDKAEVVSIFEVKNNQRGILSIAISNYTYIEGAAHGLTVIQSLTVNTVTGKQYSLLDLFSPNSNYVERISNEVRAQIRRREIPTLEPFENINPNQYFYIADKTIVIYFQAYELSPYVVGLPMFPINLFYLQDIAAQGGPIDILATNS